MPLLLNVLRNANGADYRKLRVKAVECAGLIGKFSLPLSLLLHVSARLTLSVPTQRSLLVGTYSVRMLIPLPSFSCEYKVRPPSPG